MNRYLRIILGFFFLSPGGIILLTDSLPKTFKNAQPAFKMDGKKVHRETTTRMKRYRDTTSTDPNATTDVEQKRAKENFVRVKRRKTAMMFAYSGVGYLGLQRNKGTKTIEADIMTALLKAGFINEEIHDTPQIINFQRAARTDKGVSALKQIVSLKLPDEANKEAINAHLPEQIRILGLKRVTKGFNSKNAASGRTYSYTCPSYAFASPKETNEEFRLSPERLQLIQSLLKQYEGTHNFHNFTSKRKPKDPSCSRFIISFLCEEPFIKNGVEFVTLKVKGQSFMLHQIRKMVALVMSVARGYVPPEFISKMYELEQYDLPLAPGHGLLLEQVHYDIYNERFGGDGIHETLHFDEENEEVEKFRQQYILPHLVKSDVRDKLMLEWLTDKLQDHGFETRAEKLAAIARGERAVTTMTDVEEEEDDEDDDHDDGGRRGRGRTQRRPFKHSRNSSAEKPANGEVKESSDKINEKRDSEVVSKPLESEVVEKCSMTKASVIDLIEGKNVDASEKMGNVTNDLVDKVCASPDKRHFENHLK